MNRLQKVNRSRLDNCSAFFCTPTGVFNLIVLIEGSKPQFCFQHSLFFRHSALNTRSSSCMQSDQHLFFDHWKWAIFNHLDMEPQWDPLISGTEWHGALKMKTPTESESKIIFRYFKYFLSYIMMIMPYFQNHFIGFGSESQVKMAFLTRLYK